MNRKLLVLLALLALPLLAPRTAAAQFCNGACVTLRDAEGNTAGYGCVTKEGSMQACYATNTRCRLQNCYYAAITDAEGRLLSVVRECVGDSKPAVAATKPPVKHHGGQRSGLAADSRRRTSRPATDLLAVD